MLVVVAVYVAAVTTVVGTRTVKDVLVEVNVLLTPRSTARERGQIVSLSFSRK